MHSEDIGVHACEDLLSGCHRSSVVVGALVIRCRESGDVELAVDGHRQSGNRHDDCGHHIAREHFGEFGAHLRRLRRPGDVSDETLVAWSVFPHHHGRLLHCRGVRQRRLDLAELDAVTTHFHLFVGARVIDQLPVGTPAHEIAGAVNPFAGWTERAGHETRRRQSAAPPIAQSDAMSGDVELTDHPGRNRSQPAVEDEQRGARHRGADGWGAALRLQRCTDRREDRRLGRPVDVDQRPPVVGPGPERLHRPGFTTHQHRRRLQPVGLERGHRGGCLAQHGHALGAQQRVKAIRRQGHAFGDDHQTCTAEQRAPQLPAGEVERIRVELCPHLIAMEGHADRGPVEQCSDVAMIHRNAFRHSGGAGGVDHVGDVPRIRFGQRRHRPLPAAEVIRADDRQIAAGEAICHRRDCHRRHRHGVTDDELDPRRRVGGIDGYVGRPTLQYREDGDHRIGAAREAQRNGVSRSGTGIDQQMRQPGRCRVDLAIGHRLRI
ncbi:hypothetical protein MOBUDSM44075_04208 [Mycolicibacterium obuense]|uniref:Uncharacterized protein n=1 Tax=Mycolicibacterium obuense TaxID=1807 RepID=A0A0J6YEV3_9MYCO|nr:hypothetical protein MOBUDSM44075_04208 [Mycolicibacterium obuense]